MPKCPLCDDEMDLSTPDYGYGYGAEYCCHCNGARRTYSTNRMSPEERKEGLEKSSASRALSKANAEKYRKE